MAGFTPQGEDTSIRDSLAMRQLGATISPKRIDKALKPYRLDDARVKGKSDAQLYSMAERAVVKWWQRNQQDKISSKYPGKKDTPKEAQAEKELNKKVDRAMGRIPNDMVSQAARERAEDNAREARRQKNDLLRGTGLYSVDPPAYAMTSVRNLRAWINRQVSRRNRLAQARDTFNR